MQERRKCQRLPLCLSVKYKKPKDSSFHNAACKNIGGKGLKIFLPEGLKTKEEVEILLYLPDKSGVISSLCRVVWCTQNNEGNFAAGLEFVKLKERQRLMEFLCERMIDLSLR